MQQLRKVDQVRAADEYSISTEGTYTFHPALVGMVVDLSDPQCVRALTQQEAVEEDELWGKTVLGQIRRGALPS